MGRPSDFTQEVADQICQHLIEGMSLRSICEQDDMPAKTTVMRWLASNKEFRDQYARARVLQADHMAEEILEIADTPLLGVRSESGTNKDGSFEKTVEEDMLGHRRLQVEARKWLMSKLAPKKYGEKVELEHQGSVDLNVTRLQRVIVRPDAVDPNG